MALSHRFPIGHDVVFSHGSYLVNEVVPVIDFDRSTKENKVQAVDPDTGLLLWSVDVLDADPEAKRHAKTVAVKIAAKVQPVPPAPDGSSPFTPVVFDGLTALAWVEKVGEDFSRVSWSYKADGLRAPGKTDTSTTATKSDGKSSTTTSSSSSSSSTAA